jgi:hypothetical protein
VLNLALLPPTLPLPFLPVLPLQLGLLLSLLLLK